MEEGPGAKPGNSISEGHKKKQEPLGTPVTFSFDDLHIERSTTQQRWKRGGCKHRHTQRLGGRRSPPCQGLEGGQCFSHCPAPSKAGAQAMAGRGQVKELAGVWSHPLPGLHWQRLGSAFLKPPQVHCTVLCDSLVPTKESGPFLDPRTPQVLHLTSLSFAPSTPRHKNTPTPNTVPGWERHCPNLEPSQIHQPGKAHNTTLSLSEGTCGSSGDQRGGSACREELKGWTGQKQSGSGLHTLRDTREIRLWGNEWSVCGK